MKFITVHEAVETISGTASRSTSRPPQGRDHQLVCSLDSGIVVVVSSVLAERACTPRELTAKPQAASDRGIMIVLQAADTP